MALLTVNTRPGCPLANSVSVCLWPGVCSPCEMKGSRSIRTEHLLARESRMGGQDGPRDELRRGPCASWCDHQSPWVNKARPARPTWVAGRDKSSVARKPLYTERLRTVCQSVPVAVPLRLHQRSPPVYGPSQGWSDDSLTASACE